MIVWQAKVSIHTDDKQVAELVFYRAMQQMKSSGEEEVEIYDSINRVMKKVMVKWEMSKDSFQATGK